MRRAVVLAVLALALFAGAGLRASGPSFWTVATAAEFLKGTSDGVYVSLAGVLRAGPQLTTRLTAAPAQIWSLAEGADGTLFAGTGGDGRVLRVRPGGTREDTAFDAEENNVFALAVSGNRLYAATSPDGRVYAIEADGSAKPFFDPSEKYIWALGVDVNGRLWVGAGNPAVIYRVDAAGQSTVVYRPPAAHVVSLARDDSGRMLAGTESPGRLYRFDTTDRPFVVLDSGLTELRAVTSGANGTLFAAAVSRGDDAASSAGETTSIAAIVASGTTTPSTTSASASPSSTSSRKSILYRIDSNGSWEAIWETPDTIYDLANQDDGGVLVATGPEGRLYKVDRTRQVQLLTGVDAKQITRFTRNAKSGALSAFATANPGRVLSVGAGEQASSSFVSAVRDTKSVSTWGLIRWESAGGVVLYTRSGNTEKPDDSWTDWTGPYGRREGEPIRSPSARFVQWRAVLTRPSGSPAPQLTAVTVAYLARNSRPEVTSVTVHPPGVVFQRPFSSEEGAVFGLDEATADARRPPGDPGPPSASPGRRMYQKGLQTLVWRAEDDDADHLTYSIQYRREGETNWTDLRKDLNETIFVWDTTSVADGRYIIRVSASDAPSNSIDRVLTGERESDPVQVDNTPPVVSAEIVRQGNASRLVVRVRDLQSPIQKVEYSLGGGSWVLVYPADGLADSPEERYEIPLATDADAARIVVRAFDLLQNVTSQPGRP